MPKRSKSSSGKRRANLKRLRHAYYLHRKRSLASKRGWVTRRLREQGAIDKPEQETIERLSYKPKKGGLTAHFEIVRVGTRIIRLSIGNRTYIAQSDIQAFSDVLTHAKLDS